MNGIKHAEISVGVVKTNIRRAEIATHPNTQGNAFLVRWECITHPQ